jgi:hypothetical protein
MDGCVGAWKNDAGFKNCQSNLLTRTQFTYYYYCKRENEKVASEISTTNYFDGSQSFRNYAPQYFSDHPTIPEKIRNNEKGYSARFIEDIVREYNGE